MAKRPRPALTLWHYARGIKPGESMSEKLANDIDRAVSKISAEAYAIALDQISKNRVAMDKIVEVLVEKETMSGDEFRELLAQYTTIPESNLVTPLANTTS